MFTENCSPITMTNYYFSERRGILSDAAGKASVAALAGVILGKFSQTLRTSLWGMAGALFASRLIVKLGERFHITPLKNLERASCRLIETLPRIQLITFLFAMVMGYLWPIAGIIVATMLGVLGGLAVETQQYQQLQKNT